MEPMMIVWLVALIVFAVGEGLTVGLTSVGFAVGSLGALIAAGLGGGLWVLIAIFLVLSGLSMLLLRPLAKKYLKPGYTATNADRVIGQVGVVTQTVDELAGTGEVRISGQVWSARLNSREGSIPVGEKVRVLDIRGVKVLVEPLAEHESNKEGV